jgi:hypothetical protein
LMSLCCECCVLSGRGLCDELITRPEESYRLWCVVVCDLETSWMRRPWPTGGLSRQKNKIYIYKLCIKHQLDAQIIIYSYNVTIPLHVSSNKFPSSGGHIVYTQPMVPPLWNNWVVECY